MRSRHGCLPPLTVCLFELPLLFWPFKFINTPKQLGTWPHHRETSLVFRRRCDRIPHRPDLSKNWTGPAIPQFCPTSSNTKLVSRYVVTQFNPPSPTSVHSPCLRSPRRSQAVPLLGSLPTTPTTTHIKFHGPSPPGHPPAPASRTSPFPIPRACPFPAHHRPRPLLGSHTVEIRSRVMTIRTGVGR